MALIRMTLTAVSVLITGGPGGLLDWVGLYRVGAAAPAWTDWKRMSGTKLAPKKPLTTATLTFALPSVGLWELRMFGGTGYGLPLGIYPLLHVSSSSNEIRRSLS